MTDANVALGRLDGDEASSAAGCALDVAAARAAIEHEVATPLGLAAEAAAEGMLAVTNANLGAAIRLSLFEKGLDPRDFVHDRLRRRGGSARGRRRRRDRHPSASSFPESASTLSAYGILHRDLAHDLVRSRVLAADARTLARSRRCAESSVAEAQGAARRRRRTEPRRGNRARRRHALQGPGLRADGARARHGSSMRPRSTADRRFPRSPPAALLLRQPRRAGGDRVVAGLGHRPPAEARHAEAAPLPATAREAGRQRKVWIRRLARVPVWDRADIAADAAVEGPAVIEEAYTTRAASPRLDLPRRDPSGHLIARRAR